MRIAQVAPLYESVPPRLYGGTERVVSYLTEELVALGHEVTLFATGDSRTGARLVSVYPEALRLAAHPVDDVALSVLMLEEVARQADQFDLIHSHLEYLHLPILARASVPVLTTPHGRLDQPHWPMLARSFPDAPLASISDSQRAPIPDARWVGTVHHGLPEDAYRASSWASGGNLLFLGRLSPEKRVDRAIEIAGRAGLPLRIAAKVGEPDRPYFEEVVRPLLRAPHVEFLGEVDEEQKEVLLREAVALLFPIDWPEPFGLVLIEAMACGTPVIAFRHGSVPELVEDGATGAIVQTLDDAVGAVERVAQLDRRAIRARWEERFTARRMACEYLALYEQLLAGRRSETRPREHLTRPAWLPATPLAPLTHG
jgi:glycosyltransferase involved in cell wall biosynthesis